jgi:hypothetical protein
MEPVDLAGWCAPTVTVTSGGLDVEHGHVRTSDVHRMVRTNAGQVPEWVVFAANRWDPRPGVVLQVESGVPVVEPWEGPPVSRPLLKRADGTIVTVDQIEDMLVRPNELKVVSCR